MLNPAILVPQDFYLIITLPFLCLKVIKLKRSIKYIGPKIWNFISHNLKIMTCNKFEKHYKSVLLLND